MVMEGRWKGISTVLVILAGLAGRGLLSLVECSWASAGSGQEGTQRKLPGYVAAGSFFLLPFSLLPLSTEGSLSLGALPALLTEFPTGPSTGSSLL